MRTYSIYVHTNKADGKKYYGMTLQKPHRRWGLNGNNYRSNREFRSAIAKYGWDGFAHEVLASGLPFHEAYRLEQAYIMRDDTTNPAKGYNRVPGTYATREKCYKNIAAAKMGHAVSQSTREKIRRNTKRLAVVQYTASGEALQIFPSLTEAAAAVALQEQHVGRLYRRIGNRYPLDPLKAKTENCVGRLAGYGNAINVIQATDFVRAYLLWEMNNGLS